VESFHPTIFKFNVDGFVRVCRGEFVSYHPHQAISSETIPIAEAVIRWNIQVLYADDLDDLIDCLDREGIYFDEQT
jgi:hypothetical protein